jgi:hypothetical protein
VLSSFAGLLRLASLVICLIVIASFTIFVVNQTSSASTHQQEELGGTPATTTVTPGSPPPKTQPPHKSTVHKTIDEASDGLTSPFSGITSGFSSQWAIRGIKLLLALVLYGFGLGFLARVIRVRV